MSPRSHFADLTWINFRGRPEDAAIVIFQTSGDAESDAAACIPALKG
jgi:hypothetical protein